MACALAEAHELRCYTAGRPCRNTLIVPLCGEGNPAETVDVGMEGRPLRAKGM